MNAPGKTSPEERGRRDDTRNDDGTPKNHAAAQWLEAQVRGVADHYDTPARAYAAGRSTKSGRPSALITHGQQPERW